MTSGQRPPENKKMLRRTFQGKCMFNKRLIEQDEMSVAVLSESGLHSDKKRAAKTAALRSLTGRRQTERLQPLGKNPEHWMHTVNACKA
jgi:hypothetical protein